jgi:hypothetical protein
MKLRQLSRKEMGVIFALCGLVLEISEGREDHPMLKEIKLDLGVDLLAELKKLQSELPGNYLFLLDLEGEKPQGEPKIMEVPLTEYGQHEGFKLKPMKFPYKKEGEA